MVETVSRLYHCHKIHKHITIYEEYEVSGNNRRLLRCSCPYHQYKEMKPHCAIMILVSNVVMQKINNQAYQFIWPLTRR